MHSGEDRTAQATYSEIPRKNGDQAAGDCQQSLALYPPGGPVLAGRAQRAAPAPPPSAAAAGSAMAQAWALAQAHWKL